ncbi:MAG TPA: M48 family metalloprotease [Terracidiphilus sp.]|jgi:hypothetical protein|nr:M48 family metalloprotease [Terracidiphilus sp.]
MIRRVLLLSSFCLTMVPSAARAMKEGACSLNPPPDHVNRSNIFTEQQEQWLGDAQADMIEPRYVLEPKTGSAYLNAIGLKLAAQLPEAGAHYSFRIFESADMRAFSLAGGPVYISRKLVMDARNEDELAAMLAQEIGRVYIHHSASVVTLRLRVMMGVKGVSDRADILDKFQRLLNIPVSRDAQLVQSDEEKDELLADHVGLYVMIKAGYAPQAFATFLDRITLNGGFTGSFFSDLLELTPEASVRIRQAKKVVDALPDSCRMERPQFYSGFKPFEDEIRVRTIDPIVAATPGLRSFALDEPMNPALENVRLSPDGKFALAQDQMQIHVLAADPPKVLFSIDARNAELAQFTPDSQNVAFNYESLRVEKWNIAMQQPAGVLDFPDYAGCAQTSLSPDGDLFACISRNNDYLWLRLIDLQTGEAIYQNMKFHDSNYSTDRNPFTPQRAADLIWSPDARYFLAVAGEDHVAIDLQSRREVQLQGALKGIYQGRMTFIDAGALVFGCNWTPGPLSLTEQFQMCYATFPRGKATRTFKMGYQWLSGVTRGPWMLRGPNDKSAAMFFNPITGQSGQAFQLEPADRSGDMVAAEKGSGGIEVRKEDGSSQTAKLPATPLPFLEGGSFSVDGRFLAISDRARGAVWDLDSGKRLAVTGPFRTASFDAQGKLQAVEVSQQLNPSSQSVIDSRMHKSVRMAATGKNELRFGDVLVGIHVTDAKNGFLKDMTLDGFDASSGAKLWSKRFENGYPDLTQADGNEILMTTDWNSPIADDLLSHNLMRGDRSKFVRTSDQSRWSNNGGFLIAILDGLSGTALRVVQAPELGTEGATARSAALFGDWLCVNGNRNNTVVYRTSDGVRQMAFFGRALAGDSRLGLIAATNRPQELLVYDVATGRAVQHLTLDQPLLLARFVRAKKQLLVLTGSQRVYVLDVSGATP